MYTKDEDDPVYNEVCDDLDPDYASVNASSSSTTRQHAPLSNSSSHVYSAIPSIDIDDPSKLNCGGWCIVNKRHRDKSNLKGDVYAAEEVGKGLNSMPNFKLSMLTI